MTALTSGQGPDTLYDLLKTVPENLNDSDVYKQLLRLSLDDLEKQLTPKLDLTKLKHIASQLGSSVVSKYYTNEDSVQTHRLVTRKKPSLICWDIYEFMRALSNGKSDNDTTARLVSQPMEASQAAPSEVEERIEVAEMSLRNLLDIVSKLNRDKAEDKREIAILRERVAKLEQRQCIIDSAVNDAEKAADGYDNVTKKRKVGRVQQEDALINFNSPISSRMDPPGTGVSNRLNDSNSLLNPLRQAGLQTRRMAQQQTQQRTQTPRQILRSEQTQVKQVEPLGRSYANVVQTGNDGFQEAGGRRRRPKKTTIIKGTSTTSPGFKTVEKRFHYCISGLHPDTHENEVKAYVKDKVGANPLEVELIKNRFEVYSKHKMFRVTVGASDESKMTCASNWHQNISVRRFRMIPQQTCRLQAGATNSKATTNEINRMDL